jgi:hypothetical protein
MTAVRAAALVLALMWLPLSSAVAVAVVIGPVAETSPARVFLVVVAVGAALGAVLAVGRLAMRATNSGLLAAVAVAGSIVVLVGGAFLLLLWSFSAWE